MTPLKVKEPELTGLSEVREKLENTAEWLEGLWDSDMNHYAQAHANQLRKALALMESVEGEQEEEEPISEEEIEALDAFGAHFRKMLGITPELSRLLREEHEFARKMALGKMDTEPPLDALADYLGSISMESVQGEQEIFDGFPDNVECKACLNVHQATERVVSTETLCPDCGYPWWRIFQGILGTPTASGENDG